jgi:hypothetical protein
MACGLEHLFVVGRLGRFEQEHLNEGSCMLTVGISLAEVHSGLNHLRVIEYHQSPFGKIVRQIIE